MISALADPWVLVASFHRQSIENFQANNPQEMRNVTFVYVPQKPWHYRPTPVWKWIEGSAFKPVMNMAYALWLRDAFKVARRLHREQRFDLAHQLTYVGFRFPGRLWKLDIPFFWGPIGGLENTPWRFLPVLGWKGAAYYAGRNVINSLQKLTLRSSRKAFQRAAVAIAATSGIQREIKRWYGVDSRVICEVGPPEMRVESINPRGEGEPLRILWSGEHLPGKALPLLLQALSQTADTVHWQLDILGDGPSCKSWRRLADDLGVGGQCHWLGSLSREEALAMMKQGHLFVITSLKDLTSTVLLEALSLGLPVICPDHCGFADVVDSSCGIKIPMNSPAGLIDGMKAAIESVCEDEQRRRAMAEGAIHRAGMFSWEKKQAVLEALYEEALASCSG